MKTPFRLSLALVAMPLLAGCAQIGLFAQKEREPAVGVGVESPDPETPRPETRPVGAGIRPPPGARTAEEFDTTTAAERVAALAPPAAATRELGRTIASLGAPSEPGYWLRTPLVDAVRAGRVRHEPSGASVRVELRPSGGAPGSGSQLSLAAFRALELPLTDLPELLVLAE